MAINIGLNGFGRIGRMIFRIAQKRKNINIVAINDLCNIDYIAYMLKFDSTHGRFKKEIFAGSSYLTIDNKKVYCFSEKNPSKLPWKDLNVDIVIEATGFALTKENAHKHILSGAKKVIMTAPPHDDTPMFVMGVNHETYNGEKIISNASCTTNCLAPIAKILHNHYEIKEALMTTVHAATATQHPVDGQCMQNWRLGRSCLNNIIPTRTGAAEAVGKVIPELKNKITGISFRIPTLNVSVVDLTVNLVHQTSYNDVCSILKIASKSSLKGILGYIEEDVVSSDFNGEYLTSIFDAKAGMALNNNFMKLVSWYDNESGYSSKVLDLAQYIY